MFPDCNNPENSLKINGHRIYQKTSLADDANMIDKEGRKQFYEVNVTYMVEYFTLVLCEIESTQIEKKT